MSYVDAHTTRPSLRGDPLLSMKLYVDMPAGLVCT